MKGREGDGGERWRMRQNLEGGLKKGKRVK